MASVKLDPSRISLNSLKTFSIKFALQLGVAWSSSDVRIFRSWHETGGVTSEVLGYVASIELVY